MAFSCCSRAATAKKCTKKRDACAKLLFHQSKPICHLHISLNASYLPPKFCITFVFHFSWVLQPSQEKLKTLLIQNFGGQIRCIMGDVQVAYCFFLSSLPPLSSLLEFHFAGGGGLKG